MLSAIVQFLILFGCAFVLIAAIGVARFPDFYTRIHAATKAGAFGGAVLALAAGLSFGSFSGYAQTALIILFFYITTPVASHLLGRVAGLRNVPMFFNTKPEPHTPDSASQAPRS